MQHNLASSVLFPTHPFVMDVEYSIGVNNRFGLLNFDDEDPEDILSKQEKKEEPSKKEKAKKHDKKPAKQPVKESKPAVSKKDVVNEEPRREGWYKFAFLWFVYKLYDCDAIVCCQSTCVVHSGVFKLHCCVFLISCVSSHS